MKLPTFNEILTRSKEKIDEELVAIKLRQMKAQAQVEQGTVETELVNAERGITEYMTSKDVKLTVLADMVDKIALLERKKEQLASLIAELFPEETPKKSSKASK